MSDALGRPVGERLSLARELLQWRTKIVQAPAAQRINATVLAKNRMGVIRKALLGTPGGAQSLTSELLIPGKATPLLIERLKAVKNAPRAVQVATATYAEAVFRALSIIQNAERSAGLSNRLDMMDDELLDLLTEVGMQMADGSSADFVINDCLAEMTLTESIAADLKEATLGGRESDYKVSEDVRALAAQYDAVMQEDSRYWLARRQTPMSADETAQAFQKYNEWRQTIKFPVQTAQVEVLSENVKRVAAAFSRVGRNIMQPIMDASPVTPEAATAWANEQEVTKQAQTRLKKIGYPLDKLRADMAEFYRFTGGRVYGVRVHSKGDRRANATDIEAHGKVGTINLDTSFNKRTLWHELAHHMEADPVAKMAAGRYIKRRSVDGGKTHTLRKLSGNTSYRADEVAYNGKFFSPYVGKVYRDGITEVFAMGVESFSEPETLARRMANDPETLQFVAGFVKRPMDPLARAHMELREMLSDMVSEVSDAGEQETERIIKRLAKDVTITPDTDDSWARSHSMSWFLSKLKQVGTFDVKGDKFILMSGKVSNWETRRQVTGFLILEIPKTDSLLDYRTHCTKDMDVIKAMIAIYKIEGRWPMVSDMKSASFLLARVRP